MIPTIDEYWEEEGEETGEEDASLDEDDLFNDNSNEESEDGGHGKKSLMEVEHEEIDANEYGEHECRDNEDKYEGGLN